MDRFSEMVDNGYVRIPDDGSRLRAHGFDLGMCVRMGVYAYRSVGIRKYPQLVSTSATESMP